MPLSVTIPTLGKGRNVKDIVISILASEWPLGAKKIYNKVRKDSPVTYQAVHKVLKELVEQGVLEKEGKEYKLSMEWIESIKLLGGNLEKTYKKGKDIQKELKEGPVNLTFNRQVEAGKFIIDFLLERGSELPKDEPIFCVWGFVWCPLTLSEIYYRKMRALLSKRKILIIANSDTIYDKWLAQTTWKKLGADMKIGINCATECDTIVIGDYVVNVFWPERLKKLVAGYAKLKTINELDVNYLYKDINDIDMDTYVIINKNSDVAQQTRQKVLKTLKGNRFSNENKTKILVFKTIHDMDKFLLGFLADIFSGKSKDIVPLCSHWKHTWWPLFHSRSEYGMLKNIPEKDKVYITCKSNSAIEKWCAHFYKKLGMNIKTGVDSESNFDFIVYGDTIVQMYIPKNLREAMDKAYSKIRNVQDIDLNELFKNVFERKGKIQIMMIRNTDIAKQLRQKTLGCFRR